MGFLLLVEGFLDALLDGLGLGQAAGGIQQQRDAGVDVSAHGVVVLLKLEYRAIGVTLHRASFRSEIRDQSLRKLPIPSQEDCLGHVWPFGDILEKILRKSGVWNSGKGVRSFRPKATTKHLGQS